MGNDTLGHPCYNVDGRHRPINMGLNHFHNLDYMGNWNMKSRQEIFDIVAVHLLTQNKKSVAYDSFMYRHQYRGDNGLKCPIGCLISDEDYMELIEGYMPAGLFQTFPRIMKASGLREEDSEFLRSLQIIHDFNTVKFWPYELRIFARNNELDASCLEQWKEKE